MGIEIRYNEKPDAVLCVLVKAPPTSVTSTSRSIPSAVWKLPVVFLVENNQYGMGTEVGKASAVSDTTKGCAYDIAHRQRAAQDVFPRRTRSSVRPSTSPRKAPFCSRP